MEFTGEITRDVDGKGRVSFPVDFRRVLDAGDTDRAEGQRPRVRIVYGDPRRKYLECYTIAAYQKILARIALLDEGSDDREILELFMITGSDLAELDNDGRIVFSNGARERLGLDPKGETLVFAGALSTFRIWRQEDYAAEKLAKLDAVKARLAGNANVLTLLPKAPAAAPGI